jgi:capsular exopolysaccharide synthesis family protein
VQEDSDPLNLEQALSVLWRRLPLIVLCVVVVAGAAYAFSKHQTKKYTATAALAFSNNPLSQQIAGLPSSSTGNLLAQQASNLELVKLGDMAEKTAATLGHGLTEQRVAKGLSISGAGESSIVSVSSTATSPTLAAAIANTYTHQFVTEQQTANQHYFKSALALVNKQLAAIPPKERFGAAAVELQSRAQTLKLLDQLRYGNVEVAQEATVPSAPSSPKTSRNTLIGGVVGLLIGLGIAFVFERLNRDVKIRDPQDLEATYSLPLLGVVPESNALARLADGRGRGALGEAIPPAEAEAFHLIRAHMRFFDVEDELRTILIASATGGDGKTIVARELAAAAARMGSRVLLLEVDLRNPTLAGQLGLDPSPGLPGVIIGAVRMEDAIQSVTLAAPPGEGSEGRTLDVLTAGSSAPPNPGELLESRAMGIVLQQARSLYDLVVIDTPPLSPVSDAFPLLQTVDGVVMVARIGRSPRDVAEKLHRTLESSRVRLLGVIANGVKPSDVPPPYPYRGRTAGGPTIQASPNGVGPVDAPVPSKV